MSDRVVIFVWVLLLSVGVLIEMLSPKIKRLPLSGDFWKAAARRCSTKIRINSSITEDISAHFSLPALGEENANEWAVLSK